MKLKKRIAAFFIAGAMLFSTLPANALAMEATDESKLCEHHPEHTEACGYTEGEPGTPCNHEYNDDCYTLTEECTHKHSEECYPAGEGEALEPENCAHQCSEENGCITKTLNCQHKHDSQCGYTEATPGQPCTFACEICSRETTAPEDTEKAFAVENIQAIIDALPQEVTEDNRAEVRRLLDEILALYGKLTAEEQEQVNLARCLELQAALDPANLPMTAAGTLTIGNTQLTVSGEYPMGGGNVRYDADTNTITLNNCSLPGKEIVHEHDQDAELTIELIGENSLQMINVCNSRLYIKGPGSLQIQNDTLSCINQSSAYGKVVISDGAKVTLTSENSIGVYAPDGVEITDSTVTISARKDGISSNGGSIKITNSRVKAESTYEFDNTNYHQGIYGKKGVIITNCTDEVIAISAGSVGIWGSDGTIEIDNSKVTAKGYYPGLNGEKGVVIQNGSEVNATSSDDCGIFSPATIEINNSQVNAEGYYAGLRGNTEVIIQENSKVGTTSSNDCGIFSPETITIRNSEVTANGYYAGLQGNTGVIIQEGSKVETISQEAAGIFVPNDADINITGSEVTAKGFYAGLQKNGETSGAIIITDSKITAIATEEGTGSGIYTKNGLEIQGSEIYADGSFLGIYFEGAAANVSNSWVRAENDIGMEGGEEYKPTNSVTIQSGEWWVAGNAKIPEGVLIKQDDQIRIPKNASLSIGETGTKVLGEADGITVDADGALLLPAGTVIEGANGTKQIIGPGGGKITLGGIVHDFTEYTTNDPDSSSDDEESSSRSSSTTYYTLTFETNGGSAIRKVKGKSGKIIDLYNYSPTRAGYDFYGWYLDKELTHKITEIRLNGNKTVYAKWTDHKVNPSMGAE